MSATELVAVVVACVVAGLGGALVVLAVQLRRTLRSAADTLDALRADTLAAVEELREVSRRAEYELDRVDALYGSAEALSATADHASRIAYRTVSNPVVKAMALGAGTREAIRRLRSER